MLLFHGQLCARSPLNGTSNLRQYGGQMKDEMKEEALFRN